MKLSISIKRGIITTPVKANLEDVHIELDDIKMEDLSDLTSLYTEGKEEKTIDLSSLDSLLKNSPFGSSFPGSKAATLASNPLFKTVAAIDPKDIANVLKGLGGEISSEKKQPFNLQSFLQGEMKDFEELLKQKNDKE